MPNIAPPYPPPDLISIVLTVLLSVALAVVVWLVDGYLARRQRKENE